MKNKFKISLFLAISLLLAGSYISLDWARLFLMPTESYTDSFLLVKIFKLTTTFLCALMAMTTFQSGVLQKDSFRLKLSFACILAGDIAFFFMYDIAGVIIFILGQLFITIRNSQGVIDFFRSGKGAQHKRYIFITALAVIITDVLLIWLVFYKNEGFSLMFKAFALYSVVLSLSVWIAWLVPKIGTFPPVNSLMITCGMTLFFLCDFTVGYGFIADTPVMKVVATSATWVFYAPALILLCLSGYSFKSAVPSGKS